MFSMTRPPLAKGYYARTENCRRALFRIDKWHERRWTRRQQSSNSVLLKGLCCTCAGAQWAWTFGSFLLFSPTSLPIFWGAPVVALGTLAVLLNLSIAIAIAVPFPSTITAPPFHSKLTPMITLESDRPGSRYDPPLIDWPRIMLVVTKRSINCLVEQSMGMDNE